MAALVHTPAASQHRTRPLILAPRDPLPRLTLPVYLVMWEGRWFVGLVDGFKKAGFVIATVHISRLFPLSHHRRRCWRPLWHLVSQECTERSQVVPLAGSAGRAAASISWRAYLPHAT